MRLLAIELNNNKNTTTERPLHTNLCCVVSFSSLSLSSEVRSQTVTQTKISVFEKRELNSLQIKIFIEQNKSKILKYLIICWKNKQREKISDRFFDCGKSIESNFIQNKSDPCELLISIERRTKQPRNQLCCVRS